MGPPSHRGAGPPSLPQHSERTNSEGPQQQPTLSLNHHNNHQHHHHLSKSQSFSAEPHSARLFLPTAAGGSSTVAAPPPTPSSGGGGGIISPLDIQRARSQLKSSRSFPDMAEDGDNSSSGVSSDQDQDSVVTTILPLPKGGSAACDPPALAFFIIHELSH